MSNWTDIRDGVLEQINAETISSKFKEAGFTNYYEPIFYFCKGLACEDKYPVSFDIQVVKKTRKIKSIGVLDEQFLQPHYVNDSLLNQIKSHVHKLVEYGILEYIKE